MLVVYSFGFHLIADRAWGLAVRQWVEGIMFANNALPLAARTVRPPPVTFVGNPGHVPPVVPPVTYPVIGIYKFLQREQANTALAALEDEHVEYLTNVLTPAYNLGTIMVLNKFTIEEEKGDRARPTAVGLFRGHRTY